MPSLSLLTSMSIVRRQRLVKRIREAALIEVLPYVDHLSDVHWDSRKLSSNDSARPGAEHRDTSLRARRDCRSERGFVILQHYLLPIMPFDAARVISGQTAYGGFHNM